MKRYARLEACSYTLLSANIKCLIVFLRSHLSFVHGDELTFHIHNLHLVGSGTAAYINHVTIIYTSVYCYVKGTLKLYGSLKVMALFLYPQHDFF